MRCQALLSKHYMRTKRDDPNADRRCRRIAEFGLGGFHYCSEHASMRLLEGAKVSGAVTMLSRDPLEKETSERVHICQKATCRDDHERRNPQHPKTVTEP